MPEFQGTAVHDHRKPYYTFTDCTHAECNAHHIRNLKGIHENYGHEWALEMIDDGVDVKYINFFINQENTISRSNMDDPKYWESQCEYLGSYNGYKFLFLESSVGIRTSAVRNRDISNSISWPKVFGASVKTAVDVFATGYLDTINTSFGIISNFSGIRATPINITYGKSEGYIEFGVILNKQGFRL